MNGGGHLVVAFLLRKSAGVGGVLGQSFEIVSVWAVLLMTSFNSSEDVVF